LFDYKLKVIFQAFLELEITPDTTFTEAKRQYHDLLQVWHPDKYSGDLRLQELSEEKTKRLNAAWMLVNQFFSAQEAIVRQEHERIHATQENKLRNEKKNKHQQPEKAFSFDNNNHLDLNQGEQISPSFKSKNSHTGQHSDQTSKNIIIKGFIHGLIPESLHKAVLAKPKTFILLTILFLFLIVVACLSGLYRSPSNNQPVDLALQIKSNTPKEQIGKYFTKEESAPSGTINEAITAYDSGNYLKALPVFKIFADKNDTVAQWYLGTIYFEGRGVARDYKIAERWYKQAAKHGDALAQNNLANIYLNGFGVSQNLEEAARWFLLAAEQGNPEAQCNIGLMYLNGNGVRKDYPEARKWLGKAAGNGNLTAKSYLKRLE